MDSNTVAAPVLQQKIEFEIGRKDRNSSMLRTVRVGAGNPLLVICGPCVIESRDDTLRLAESIAQIAGEVGVPLVFKASYDKANRTSLGSFRGVGIDEGLKILAEVRSSLGLPVVTDVHRAEDVQAAASVVDMLQIPAFLCRQTDLLLAAGSSGLPVNIKKGQFLAPEDMKFAADKVVEGGSARVLLCERGSCFGYRELVVDFRAFQMMAASGWPVIFDATHAVQQMGGAGGASSGSREFIPGLARAAVAFGVNGVFLECHPNPAQAPSDGPNMIPLGELKELLGDIRKLDQLQLNTRS